MSSAEAEVILRRLRDRGGRTTKIRRATIQVLLDAGRGHLSSEDIIRRIQLQHPEVAESTVYRQLAALEDLGVVEHVHLGHGPSTYHLTGEAHQHLVCARCGKVIEVPDDEFGALAEHLESIYGFRIRPGHFAILGECRHCSRASARKRGTAAN